MSLNSTNPTVEALQAKRSERGEDGFTLIELLVVVVIIGILVAIAIPLYLQYQNGAKNKSAESDLRGAISSAEQFYASNNNAYPASALGQTATFSLGTDAQSKQQVSMGAGNVMNFVNVGDGTYKLCARNNDGGHVFLYDSSKGGPVVDKGTNTLNNTCSY